jgi:hypothetical protein
MVAKNKTGLKGFTVTHINEKAYFNLFFEAFIVQYLLHMKFFDRPVKRTS